MKTIILLSLLCFGFKLQAQSTNIQLRFTSVESGVTNVGNFNLGTNYVLGFSISYAQNIAANGTNAPTFNAFGRQVVLDHLVDLRDLAIAAQLTSNKLDKAAQQFTTIWPNMTYTDQTNVSAIFQKYVQ